MYQGNDFGPGYVSQGHEEYHAFTAEPLGYEGNDSNDYQRKQEEGDEHKDDFSALEEEALESSNEGKSGTGKQYDSSHREGNALFAPSLQDPTQAFLDSHRGPVVPFPVPHMQKQTVPLTVIEQSSLLLSIEDKIRQEIERVKKN